MTTLHDSTCWAVIPAAGIGRRMQSETPKQYLKINDKTILEYTVALLAAHPFIDRVLLVLNSEDTQWSTIDKTKFPYSEKIVTTLGGETRADSVMRGLLFLQSMASSNDWVLVHDVVRPFLFPEVLDRFIKILIDHRIGGLLALPITDTVKRVDADHGVRETMDRQGLWAAQTPQMFRYGLLFDALQAALKANVTITDESSAIEWIGEHPLVVEGDWRNIKITHPDDLLRAKRMLLV